MGQQQSKDELLYQQVSYGNAEGIKALRREGAGLEWIDREGKTPLIVACLNSDFYNVAKTLIELGANVNAYRPGRQGGTPLHHAAKRGLESTVKLLLSHGANALVMNDDCQTPLEVARAKGHSNVVRAIEKHICLFSGWMREFYGPGFLEVFAPQLVSRKVWVVILPTGSRNPRKPFKLELAIYPSMQDALPRMVIALWKANLEEPKFNQSDPSVTIVDNSIPRGRRRRRRCRPQTCRQTRIRLAAEHENDRQQLQSFCDACKGIPQVNPAFLVSPKIPAAQATAPPHAEDLELAMAINASIQSANADVPFRNSHLGSGASASTSSVNYVNATVHSGLGERTAPEAGLGGKSSQHLPVQSNNISATQTMINGPDAVPSAPPVEVADDIVPDGPIQYPAINLGPVDLSGPTSDKLTNSANETKSDDGGGSSSCVICLDAPVEGACVPCGHMAGCMSCLNEVKAKMWGCPVCRTKIIQVIRIYSV